MSLYNFFSALGELFQTTFLLLEADLGLTFLMNTGIVVLGFLGMFYWLNWQRKFNEQAKNNPDQLK